MTITTLEAMFADICDRHEFSSISIQLSRDCSKGYEWHSYAHWNGVCTSGTGATPTAALSGAIASANERRGVKPAVHAVTIAVSPLATISTPNNSVNQ